MCNEYVRALKRDLARKGKALQATEEAFQQVSRQSHWEGAQVVKAEAENRYLRAKIAKLEAAGDRLDAWADTLSGCRNYWTRLDDIERDMSAWQEARGV